MGEVNVGKRVTEFRTLRNMSKKELAEQTGLTSSMLSQIEHALANPSISTIKNIASVLNVPLYRFFQGDETNVPPIVKKQDRRIIGYPDVDDIRYEMLVPINGGSIEMCMMYLSPSEVSSERLICHAGEEVASVLKGAVTLLYEREVYSLEQGDSVRIMPNVRHRWVNSSDTTAEIVFAITPPSF